MDLVTHKKAFAARDAHEALLVLKGIVDDAAKLLQAVQLDLFRAAITRDVDDNSYKSLQDVMERVNSPDFDKAIFVIREKLGTALSDDCGWTAQLQSRAASSTSK